MPNWFFSNSYEYHRIAGDYKEAKNAIRYSSESSLRSSPNFSATQSPDSPFLHTTMAGLQTDAAEVALSETKMAEYEYEKSRPSVDHVQDKEVDHQLDGIHDGLEFPTDEERATLRRVSDTIPWTAYREWRSKRCYVLGPIFTPYSHCYHRTGGAILSTLLLLIYR